MTDRERITKLEEKIARLDLDVREIKEEQGKALERCQEGALEGRDLKADINKIISALQLHQDWHEKQGEKKYKITDIVLALGMLALTFLMLIKQ